MTANGNRPVAMGDDEPVNESSAAGSFSDEPSVPRQEAEQLDLGFPEDGRVDVLNDRADLDVENALSPLDEIDVDLVWGHQFMVALAYLLRNDQEIDADAIRGLGVPEPARSCQWGHAILAASRRGDIVCVGARRSRRPERHGALIRVWRAADYEMRLAS